MSIRTVIIDDEIPARDELEYLLNKEKNLFDVIGKGQTGEEAIELCNKRKPDVIFLDIHMYGMNGLEAAKEIINGTSVPMIIFATAYDKYAVEAFEINAVDYILKPFSEERIQTTINKIQHLINNKDQNIGNISKAIYHVEQHVKISGKIGIWVAGRFLLIDEKDIVYIEAQRKHTLIYTTSNQYESSTPLGELEQKLNRKNFLRIHRSYIINFTFVKEVGMWFNNNLSVMMKGYEKNIIPVSRSMMKEFKHLIGM
ncbi:LytTR family DNA-binding domain-containing protein [Petroclostridium sp. X23]|uniref:LytR/AlgR family response regulator transcription factor n=1 Tax=Petroclostridium sp. X23 TaxID=3045146 RepID=UPI0024AD8662|nr:LytTR family DNA-binding domain-containing protein [Petroclostridium sp. X23]WHH60263.1 LytTR family DNA-binding domain-containing protein [Petroclostridium sp. X23]